MNLNETRYSFTNPVLWGVFIVYILIAGYTMAHHEMWGDEIHSWNIAKGSSSFFDLISNTRYEGHPPVWYIILWFVSKFTHDPVYIQLVHVTIACLIVFLVLFYSPFPLYIRMLIPFGYFFLFEYSIISRNYAIAVLLTFCICLIMYKNFRGKMLLYYLLLFLLSNTHLLALILAVSLHFCFLISKLEKGTKQAVLNHILAGAFVLLPALYFIFPPSDSELNIEFWMNRWSAERVKTFAQAPLRAFVSIPAWWNYNSWNTHILMEEQHSHSLLRIINLFVSIAILLLVLYCFKGNKKSFILFLTNLILSFIIAVFVFPMIRERYAGFLFISFIAAYWLGYSEVHYTKVKKWLVLIFLIIQIPGAVLMIIKDVQHPFSNAYKVNELLKKIPKKERIVTDYWAMNTLVTFTDRQFYCVDMEKEISFVLWGTDLGTMLAKRNRYSRGIKNLFQKEGINKLYMVSTGPPEAIYKVDSELSKSFNVLLIDKIEGAIEKGGNLYLYQITSS